MKFTNEKILVVVAHPDDEVLGIGGTINALSSDELNNDIRCIILGEGITSRSDKRDKDSWLKELETHNKNIEDSTRIIGYTSVGTYNLPDNRFDSVDLLDIIKIVEKEKKEFNPTVIFTHNGGDLNIDHQLTFQAVVTAFRPMEEEILKSLICFETMSGTEWTPSSNPFKFVPNFYFNISEENVNAKIAAMECYEYEKRKYPHPRSPKAIKIKAEQTGVSVGKKFAEAFQIIRTIS